MDTEGGFEVGDWFRLDGYSVRGGITFPALLSPFSLW